jgi:hypothetical protein
MPDANIFKDFDLARFGTDQVKRRLLLTVFLYYKNACRVKD